MGAHGYVRATDDIDLIVAYPLIEAKRRLASAGIATRHVRGDVLEGDFPCLKGEVGGVAFDILPELVPMDAEKAIELSTASGSFRVADLDGLVRLKLHAGGVQDVLDVAVLILLHPEHAPLARAAAGAYRVERRLEEFLSDPRTKATARAIEGRTPPRRPGRPRSRTRSRR